MRSHSHYSLLLALSKPEEIVLKAKELGMSYAILADTNTLAGAVKFLNACKEHKIKPIIGMELKTPEGSITLLCKNKDAWYDLVKMVARVDSVVFNDLGILHQNFVCIDGYVGSRLFKAAFPDNCPFLYNDKEKILGCLSATYREDINQAISFGSQFGNYFVELDFEENESAPLAKTWADLLVGECPNLPLINTSPTHYINREDSADHRIILCSRLKTTMRHLKEDVIKEEPELSQFIHSSSFYMRPADFDTSLVEDFSILSNPRLPKFECNGSELEYLKELCRKGWRKKLAGTEKVKTKEKSDIYKTRVLHELDVAEMANLAGYYLIVQDYVNYMESRGCLTAARGSAAGSIISYLIGINDEDPIEYDLLFERFFNASRSYPTHVSFSAFSYLEGFYSLLESNVPLEKSNKQQIKERLAKSPYFTYESGIVDKMYKGWEYYHYVLDNIPLDDNSSNSHIMWVYGATDHIDLEKPPVIIEGKSSLPDIDMDFPPDRREEVITYLKNKYGEDKVCQMVTFGRLQGKSAITEVLRANESCSFDKIKEITKKFPSEAAISDLLAEMDEPSVIRWMLEENPADLADYCYMQDGKLQGEFSKDFEQAMRIEGTFKSQGKHAAGVVVSSDILTDYVPMTKDKHGNLLAGMEMADLEAIGCVKMDILGLSLLKKIYETVEEINQ